MGLSEADCTVGGPISRARGQTSRSWRTSQLSNPNRMGSIDHISSWKALILMLNSSWHSLHTRGRPRSSNWCFIPSKIVMAPSSTPHRLSPLTTCTACLEHLSLRWQVEPGSILEYLMTARWKHCFITEMSLSRPTMQRCRTSCDKDGSLSMDSY